MAAHPLPRYASFEDDSVPKFMYGSHYSSAGVVLYYHVRQDPFTTQHINLQARHVHIFVVHDKPLGGFRSSGRSIRNACSHCAFVDPGAKRLCFLSDVWCYVAISVFSVCADDVRKG